MVESSCRTVVRLARYMLITTLGLTALHVDFYTPTDLKSCEVLAVLGSGTPQVVEERFRPQGQGDVVTVAEVARSHVGLREHCLIV